MPSAPSRTNIQTLRLEVSSGGNMDLVTRTSPHRVERPREGSLFR